MDDWSLKGKGWIDIPDLDLTPDEYNEWKIWEAQSLATTNVKLKSDKDIKVYPKEVIEILRQKLVDDICMFCIKHYWEYDTSILALIDIINKRFGKE
jgi:hypothetical protein